MLQFLKHYFYYFFITEVAVEDEDITTVFMVQSVVSVIVRELRGARGNACTVILTIETNKLDRISRLQILFDPFAF